MRLVKLLSVVGLALSVGAAYLLQASARASWEVAAPILTLFALSVSIFVAVVAEETGGDPL